MKLTKLEAVKLLLSIFLEKLPSDELLQQFLQDNDNAHLELSDFIGMNLKFVHPIITVIGVLESMDILLNDAIENGNVTIMPEGI